MRDVIHPLALALVFFLLVTGTHLLCRWLDRKGR